MHPGVAIHLSPLGVAQGAALREAEHVLQLFNAQPHPNSRVLRVERVQNLGLWRRYCRQACSAERLREARRRQERERGRG